MSSHQIRQTVRHCITVPYITVNPNVRNLIDEVQERFAEGTLGQTAIAGWECYGDHYPIANNSEMDGLEFIYTKTKALLTVYFVVCEGDDFVYFVASNKTHLAKFAKDWGITEPVQQDVELWTIS